MRQPLYYCSGPSASAQDPPLLLQTFEQAAGHLQWEVDCPPSQPAGLGFKRQWRLSTG